MVPVSKLCCVLYFKQVHTINVQSGLNEEKMLVPDKDGYLTGRDCGHQLKEESRSVSRAHLLGG